MFWTSGDGCPGFQSFGGFPCGFLRFTSGVTPADLLVFSMVSEKFHQYTCVQALVELKSTIKHAAVS